MLAGHLDLSATGKAHLQRMARQGTSGIRLSARGGRGGAASAAGPVDQSPYGIDPTRPMHWAAGGQRAFAASGPAGGPAAGPVGLMAVLTEPLAPSRCRAIAALIESPVAGVLCPVWEGPGPAASAAGGADRDWFVVCQAPPGPPLWDPAAGPPPRWSEAELLHGLIRPIGHALDQLCQRGVTHRALRPANLFRAGPADPVVAGAAWAAPPASLQPALFEPPGAAMCDPAGRGDGSVADDVYALGVTTLVLALGRLPLADLDPREITRRKLAEGSFQALVGDDRLPAPIAELARAMLAEDPDHRPPPALLADPAAARARRVAAHPARRAARPLRVGRHEVHDARTLAHALATEPHDALKLLRARQVETWLRRGLADAALAVRIEDLVRRRETDAPPRDAPADARLGMLAVAALDPLAPLCYGPLALYPDGIAGLLAAYGTDEQDPRTAALRDVLATEQVPPWLTARGARGAATEPRLAARQHRALLRLRGWGGGLARLRYTLNPTLRCASPVLSGRLVVRLADLLPALEAAAARPESRPLAPIDRELGAFIAARGETPLEAELTLLADETDPEQRALRQLALLARWQPSPAAGRPAVPTLPALAGWLVEPVRGALNGLRNRDRRAAMTRALAACVEAGDLTALLDLLRDPAPREDDAREAAAAEAEAAAIDTELAAIGAGAAGRAEQARHLGLELAACAGLVALSAMAVAIALAG